MTEVDMVNRLKWVEAVRHPELGPCWEWAKSRMKLRGGYGQVRIEGRTLKAHRVAYGLWVGSIPNGHCVLHRCDNPPCINPDHLFTGTHRDNALDKVAKGRGVNPIRYGEDVASSKLKAVDVRKIRVLLAQGDSLNSISRQFNITKQAVSSIKRGRTWTTVK